jgi:predicted transcriptional regulator
MINNELIPENIKQFIIQYIDSIAQLETLLLLRNEPEIAWDIQTISTRLYLSKPETEVLVTTLYNRGFITKSDNKKSLYAYQPNSDEIKNKIDQILSLYTKHMMPITNIIHSKQNNRIQQFADAFRIRGD